MARSTDATHTALLATGWTWNGLTYERIMVGPRYSMIARIAPATPGDASVIATATERRDTQWTVYIGTRTSNAGFQMREIARVEDYCDLTMFAVPV